MFDKWEQTKLNIASPQWLFSSAKYFISCSGQMKHGRSTSDFFSCDEAIGKALQEAPDLHQVQREQNFHPSTQENYPWAARRRGIQLPNYSLSLLLLQHLCCTPGHHGKWFCCLQDLIYGRKQFGYLASNEYMRLNTSKKNNEEDITTLGKHKYCR